MYNSGEINRESDFKFKNLIFSLSNDISTLNMKLQKIDLQVFNQKLFQKIDYCKYLDEVNQLEDLRVETVSELNNLIENENYREGNYLGEILFKIDDYLYSFDSTISELSNLIFLLKNRTEGKKTKYSDYQAYLKNYNNDKKECNDIALKLYSLINNFENTDKRNFSFLTTKGLKIRLNHDYCLNYIDMENVKAWYMSIEAFDSLRRILSIITAIILMLSHATLTSSFLLLMIMYFVGFFVSQSYFDMVILNWIYGFLYIIYAMLEKFFIPYIVLVLIGFITGELDILLVVIASRFICFIIINSINMIKGKYYYKKYGFYLGDVEITAVKLIKFYSDYKIGFREWIEGYSKFIQNL